MRSSGGSLKVREPEESQRRTFDSAADVYEDARPEYPDGLFDDLVALADLESGARLLEIGCATGKATRPLLDRGFSVVCLEIGAQLAERARQNLAGLPFEVLVTPFENWDGESEALDLVYAATCRRRAGHYGRGVNSTTLVLTPLDERGRELLDDLERIVPPPLAGI